MFQGNRTTPLQNRVTPLGEIVAVQARGTFMGNRGVLHDADKNLGAARWRHTHWVTCLLSYHGRRRTLMTPHRYTELFFLDEAVALAAGHRPCGECRRERYRAYMGLWDAQCGDLAPARPKDIDRALHAARIDANTKRQVRFEAAIATLPDGTFIIRNEAPMLVRGDKLFAYTPAGYAAPQPRPGRETVTVLTPEPNVRILRAGYGPQIHPSAC